MPSLASRLKVKLPVFLLATAVSCDAPLPAVFDRDESAVARAGSVRGTVVDARGRPVEGAWVFVEVPRHGQVDYLGPRISSWRRVGSATEPIFEVHGDRLGPARSAADGSFVLEGAPPLWEGSVHVYHRDLLPARVTGSEWLRKGHAVDVGRVTLAEGESVEGVVRDEQGDGFPGAFVAVQKVYFDTGSAADFLRARLGKPAAKPERGYTLKAMRPMVLGHIRKVTPGPGGSYRIGGLEPGVYLIAAWTEELPPVEHEIELPGPSGGLKRDFDLARGESLSVVVTYTHTGEPYPGALVRIKRRRKGAWIWDLPVVASARTDDGGRCSFHDLKPGEYYVTAIPPDRARRGVPEAFTATNAFRTGTEGQLALEPITPVTGTVVDAEDGNPIPRFEVDLEPIWQKTPPNRARQNRLVLQRHDSANGRFTFERARPGPWKVEACADGFFAKDLEIEVPETGLEGTVRVELEAGRQKTRGLALDDATGGPLEGVEVHSYEWFTRGWGSSRKTLTGPDGRYALDRLLGASDSRKVWFEKKGYVTFTLKLDSAEPFPPELETVRMVRTGSVRGVVFDEAGVPAVGFTVHLRRAPRGGKFNPEAKTDADGRFAFEEVASGRYRLTRLAGDVEVRPGETTQVEISLRADAVRREK